MLLFSRFHTTFFYRLLQVVSCPVGCDIRNIHHQSHSLCFCPASASDRFCCEHIHASCLSRDYGIFSSTALAIGNATIADMHDPTGIAYGICIWGSFGICGPVFWSPHWRICGSSKGLAMTIWVLTLLCTLMLTMLFFSSRS